MKKLYTIGYGGRTPAELIDHLENYGIVAVVDVRLRPDRSSMGAYVKAKSADKGIEALLSRASIAYFSMVELGNLFMEYDDWKPRYAELMARSGSLLTSRIVDVPTPFCLMCAEKRVDDCHRKHIAKYLESFGWTVKHIV